MGRYHVSVEAEFSASHQLRVYDGSVEPMHGHRWHVWACMAGAELDEIDVLVDFVHVESILDDVLAGYRDRHLNDLPCFGQTNPSAENVARSIFESLREALDRPELLTRVTVSEAPRCRASYGVD
ncbi:MAG: 6-carboxytetrahydropterin synthase [Phycisphaerae bacterium]|nr:6-carboxytetrahydropterin synthase [Phycisphaerae bacterium]